MPMGASFIYFIWFTHLAKSSDVFQYGPEVLVVLMVLRDHCTYDL